MQHWMDSIMEIQFNQILMSSHTAADSFKEILAYFGNGILF